MECSKVNLHLPDSEQGIPMKMLDAQGNLLSITSERETVYKANIKELFNNLMNSSCPLI